MRLWLNWIEHRSSEPRVGGSSPFRRTTTRLSASFLLLKKLMGVAHQTLLRLEPPSLGLAPVSPCPSAESSLHLTACPFRRTTTRLSASFLLLKKLMGVAHQTLLRLEPPSLGLAPVSPCPSAESSPHLTACPFRRTTTSPIGEFFII